MPQAWPWLRSRRPGGVTDARRFDNMPEGDVVLPAAGRAGGAMIIPPPPHRSDCPTERIGSYDVYTCDCVPALFDPTPRDERRAVAPPRAR